MPARSVERLNMNCIIRQSCSVMGVLVPKSSNQHWRTRSRCFAKVQFVKWMSNGDYRDMLLYENMYDDRDLYGK